MPCIFVCQLMHLPLLILNQQKVSETLQQRFGNFFCKQWSDYFSQRPLVCICLGETSGWPCVAL